VGSIVPVIGFGGPDVEVGDVYEVPGKGSRKRRIMVNAGPPPSASITSPEGSCS
jgi:hypothetical protein